jgi:hypothetical protein
MEVRCYEQCLPGGCPLIYVISLLLFSEETGNSECADLMAQ